MNISKGMPYYSVDLDYMPKNDKDRPYCSVYRSEY